MVKFNRVEKHIQLIIKVCSSRFPSMVWKDDLDFMRSGTSILMGGESKKWGNLWKIQ